MPASPPAPGTVPEPPPTAVRVDWRVAVACAVVLTLVFALQSTAIIIAPSRGQSLVAALRGQALTWGLWLALLPLVLAIARGAHGRGAHGRGARRGVTIALQLLASVGVALLHSVLYAVVRWALGLTNTGDLRVVVRNVVVISFMTSLLRYWLIAAAYHAWLYHHEVRRRDAREARLLAEARLASLEGRLQPHFLFNTLNAIAALIRKDPPAAATMVGHLSDLLRAALDAEPGREVPLARELELLERYLAIQQARFSDRLRVAVRAAPDTLGARVPHMLLQPLVENAIRHGIAPREAPGTVTVEAARRGAVLRLVVRDDGVGLGRAPRAQQGAGLGLAGTRARLAHLYGDRFALDVAAAEPTGTVVTVEIPFLGGSDAESEIVAPAEAESEIVVPAEAESEIVAPADAGIQTEALDSRLRGNDERRVDSRRRGGDETGRAPSREPQGSAR